MKEEEKQVLHFTYKSIGNFVRLLCTICYEKTASSQDIMLWHKRFDNNESDILFENFCERLFPDGKTIDVPDIEIITEYASEFLQNDEKYIEYKTKYLLRVLDSYVYFIPDNKIYECGFGEHTQTVHNILLEFFNGMDDIDENYLSKFIRENFIIKSDNTTIDTIIRDTRYLSMKFDARRYRKELKQ